MDALCAPSVALTTLSTDPQTHVILGLCFRFIIHSQMKRTYVLFRSWSEFLIISDFKKYGDFFSALGRSTINTYILLNSFSYTATQYCVCLCSTNQLHYWRSWQPRDSVHMVDTQWPPGFQFVGTQELKRDVIVHSTAYLSSWFFSTRNKIIACSKPFQAMTRADTIVHACHQSRTHTPKSSPASTVRNAKNTVSVLAHGALCIGLFEACAIMNQSCSDANNETLWYLVSVVDALKAKLTNVFTGKGKRCHTNTHTKDSNVLDE